MFRFIFALLVAFLFLIVTLPVLLYQRMVGKTDPGRQHQLAMPYIQWVFRAFLRISGMRLHVKGREHIPEDTAVLYISNHRSIFDVILTYPQFTHVTSYVSKASLQKIPWFSAWLTGIGCLYFDRNNLREGVQMLKDAMQRIREGESIFIFPEGTRSQGDSELPLLPFHEGSFRIATKTGCPIVPIAIHGSAKVLRSKPFRLCPTDVTLRFGEPIDPTSFSKVEQKHLGAHVSQVISTMLKEEDA